MIGELGVASVYHERVLRAATLVATMLMLALSGCGTDHTGTRGPAQALSERQQQILHTFAGEERATVAIIDGGVDDTHPALQGVVSSSWVAPGLADLPTLHATQLAGIIAGQQTGTFSGGLAQGARVLDAKALDAQGTGLPTDIAAALTWAGREGADVVVASFGLDNDEPAVRRAVSALVARGVLVVAATGNGYGAFDMYPALYRGVLGVTAYDSRGQRLELANWRGADAAAPGDEIWAPTLGDGYAPVSGTSVATAMAAALTAACADHQPFADGHRLAAAWSDGWIQTPEARVPKLTCP